MKEIIIILLVSILITFFIFKIAELIVFGWYIKEKDLDEYLGKHLKNYRINAYSDDILIYDGLELDKPYIAQRSIFKGWYISDYGTISRWSKWHKKIREHRDSICIKPKKKSLIDEQV